MTVYHPVGDSPLSIEYDDDDTASPVIRDDPRGADHPPGYDVETEEFRLDNGHLVIYHPESGQAWVKSDSYRPLDTGGHSTDDAR